MKNYFRLQLKKIAKILPFVMILTLTLIVGLSAILYGMIGIFQGSEKNNRFVIGVTGDTDNDYMRLGMAAMQTFDETRFSIEFAEMTEEKAQKAIETGEISAYIVIPEKFVDNALYGNIEPITFVTTAGMEGIKGLFKKEITSLVTDMVIYSQKGSYGLYDALSDNGYENIADKHLNKISIKYAELIFARGNLYKVNEVGVTDGLTTIEYYICAILVLLLVLVGLPFSAIYVKKDYALNRLLLSRGCSTFKQIIFEYSAHLLAMVLQVVMIIAVVLVAIKYMPAFDNGIFKNIATDLIFKIVPVVIMLAAFNIMMFELSSNIVSSLLIHFFTSIALCYITGCMYPIYALPKALINLSAFLPTGMARSYLASSFTMDDSYNNLLGLIAYSVAFLMISWLIRYRKTARIRG